MKGITDTTNPIYSAIKARGVRITDIAIAAGVDIPYACNRIRICAVSGKMLPAVLAATGLSPKELGEKIKIWRASKLKALRDGVES